MGSAFSVDTSINGHLHYPHDVDRSLNESLTDDDRSLNESVTDKIRKYGVDYNNNPPNAISFIPAIC
jgi:hypothetical protein